MAPRYLLDTNILVYIRRRRPPEVLAHFLRLDPGESVLSAITYGELLYGIEKKHAGPRARQELEELVSLIPVVPLPNEAGQTYGALRAMLELKGEMIGGNDLWIAAHAKSAQLTLVTNNEREFRRVPGLKIRNWTS
jgi:tRNA(fMet)-specific endonuclease VapC